MIGFMFKSLLILATAVVGSVLLVNKVPSLKANILEAVYPRAQEGKLVQQLHDVLTGIDDASTDAARNVLIEKSKALLQNISDMNAEHAGVVDGVIGKVTDVLLGTPAATSSASLTDCNKVVK
jgi:hypothetical protein